MSVTLGEASTNGAARRGGSEGPERLTAPMPGRVAPSTRQAMETVPQEPGASPSVSRHSLGSRGKASQGMALAVGTPSPSGSEGPARVTRTASATTTPSAAFESSTVREA